MPSKTVIYSSLISFYNHILRIDDIDIKKINVDDYDLYGEEKYRTNNVILNLTYQFKI